MSWTTEGRQRFILEFTIVDDHWLSEPNRHLLYTERVSRLTAPEGEYCHLEAAFPSDQDGKAELERLVNRLGKRIRDPKIRRVTTVWSV